MIAEDLHGTQYGRTPEGRSKPRIGVAYHWLVDLEGRTVTAQRLESGRWVTLGVYGDDTEAQIEPFDVVPLDVASWWPPAAPDGPPR